MIAILHPKNLFLRNVAKHELTRTQQRFKFTRKSQFLSICVQQLTNLLLNNNCFLETRNCPNITQINNVLWVCKVFTWSVLRNCKNCIIIFTKLFWYCNIELKMMLFYYNKDCYFTMIHQIWLGHSKIVTIRDLNVESVFTGFREKARQDNAINRFHSN